MKERIIGAAVLVVLAVLVVPVFLDGPPQEGEIVTERVLLPGQETQKTQTVVLDRDRTEPVPTAAQAEPEPAEPEPDASRPAPAQSQPEPDASKPVPAQSEPEPVASASKPASTPSAAVPASTTGMWAVQLGSFSNKENAEKLAADLRKQGYAAFLSQLNTANGVMHRVRIGPQKDRDSAEAMAARLAKVGHDGKVVPHP